MLAGNWPHSHIFLGTLAYQALCVFPTAVLECLHGELVYSLAHSFVSVIWWNEILVSLQPWQVLAVAATSLWFPLGEMALNPLFIHSLASEILPNWMWNLSLFPFTQQLTLSACGSRPLAIPRHTLYLSTPCLYSGWMSSVGAFPLLSTQPSFYYYLFSQIFAVH